ncbi:MAG TPA: DUF305 domain-containing protein [Ignavibacteria bacterium]|nr:DUF305 domain-containing protein [Ignavibacteria bacterium]HMQ99469.1 DUF305 domain-containing protein [Ignavibacteria bacterium]
MEKMSYTRFIITMAISFFVMYIVMFLNMESIVHYHTSLSRIYMAILMIAPMAVIMLLLMGKMYPDKKLNTGIILAALILFTVTFTALRTQTPIGDMQYMRAMISHHSSAIMTSKNANITDPEVKKLSEKIIQSQEDEIKQMELILERMK